MRIRTIKPEFFTHEGIFDLEKETGLPIRIAFSGLWCACDKEGRFKWEPRRLGIQILPYDGIDFSRVLDALITRGFVVKYESNGGVFGCVPSFTKHQVINNRETPSSLPEPPQNQRVDASVTRDSHEDDAGKAEGKGREGERKGKNTPKPPRGASDESKDPRHQQFIAIWDELYFERVGEKYGYKSRDFKQLSQLLERLNDLTTERFRALIVAAKAYVVSNPYCTYCKRATTLGDLCENYSSIREELVAARDQRGMEKNGSHVEREKPAFSM